MARVEIVLNIVVTIVIDFTELSILIQQSTDELDPESCNFIHLMVLFNVLCMREAICSGQYPMYDFCYIILPFPNKSAIPELISLQFYWRKDGG